MTKPSPRPRFDPRFALHQRQPRADKLDRRQQQICRIDPAYREALRCRVANTHRFSAFIEGISLYIDLERPCPRCGGFKRRTRDRSCYQCHLAKGGENFGRMKAGVAVIRRRNRDSHLDLLARQKREKRGEFDAAEFGSLKARRFPTGRLEIEFPDGHVEKAVDKASPKYIQRMISLLPEMNDVLHWAGWY